MLLTKKIKTKWNSKTKKYYESLGYKYTRMGDSFDIYVEHLKPFSSEKVKIRCDYCEKEYIIPFKDRPKNTTDSCNDCKNIKAKETLLRKYGIDNPMYLKSAKENLEKTNIDKYGVKCVFQNEKIKEKIKNTNIEKYGVESFTKTKKYIEKSRETCLKKYGKTHFMKTKKYRLMFSGKNSPTWKGGKKPDPRWERLSPRYKIWRNNIYGRDSFTCQKCNSIGGKLEAHHILNWNDYKDNRYNLKNGITLCQSCHIEFHRIYGKEKTTENQIADFLSNT